MQHQEARYTETTTIPKRRPKNSNNSQTMDKRLAAAEKNRQCTWLQKGCTKKLKSQNHISNFMTRKDVIPKKHKLQPCGKGVLLSKARTNRWTNCSHFLHFIKKRPSQLCSICGAKDTTEHVLNKCSMHEEGRELMMQKLCRQFERPTDLLLSKDAKTTKELADFLLEADNARTKLEEETRLKLLN